MMKIFRTASYYLDMVLTAVLSLIVSFFSKVFFSLNISFNIYIIIYFCLLYLLVSNITFIFTKGQTLFQRFLGLRVYYNGAIADTKMCRKKNLIDFLTFTVGYITIIFSNKSIGDIVFGTTVVKE